MKLSEWMALKNMRDADLAAELVTRTGVKLSRAQINRIRRGESNPRLKTARALEVVTSIPAANFVLGDAGKRTERAA